MLVCFTLTLAERRKLANEQFYHSYSASVDVKRISKLAICILDFLPNLEPQHTKYSLPRAHAQGVKQSVCPSVVVVVVVVSTKIARSRVLGICACCKHSQLVDIGEKLVFMRFKFLKKAY